ncbi:MAG: tyrosine-type recombinase/integrase, partial [Sphingomonadaceae bacterium]
MGKSAIESVRAFSRMVSSQGAGDGCLCPKECEKSGTFAASSGISDGLMVPKGRKPARRALLDGNFVRRKLRLRETEYCIWDTELAGFGLRVRPSGNYFWFVRLRHRGKHRRITLGRTDELDANVARAQARRFLAETALDGLPKRVVVKATPTMNDFVETYWPDLARGWKDSTAYRNLNAWRNDLSPHFGESRVADIARTDVVRWKDGCAGENEARYNRALPVLSSLFKYAEALKMRRKGSNPCRGMPRYKRPKMERYLTPKEYRRLALELREEEKDHPAEVAIIRMLIYTGARLGEIRDLRWEWVKPPRLTLPDSKTGPRIVWLNSQALAILEGMPRRDDCPLVFPGKRADKPVLVEGW